jgi:hypothetical protein
MFFLIGDFGFMPCVGYLILKNNQNGRDCKEFQASRWRRYVG